MYVELNRLGQARQAQVVCQLQTTQRLVTEVAVDFCISPVCCHGRLKGF